MPLTSISLNKSSTSLEINNQEILTATILPVDATNKEAVWKISDPEKLIGASPRDAAPTLLLSGSFTAAHERLTGENSIYAPGYGDGCFLGSISVNDFDIVAVRCFFKTTSVPVNMHITGYLWDSLGASLTGTFGALTGSLWSASIANDWQEAISVVRIPPGYDIKTIKFYLIKGYVNTQPAAGDVHIARDIQIFKGFPGFNKKPAAKSNFTSNRVKFDQLGNIQVHNGTAFEDFFLFGIYDDFNKADYSVYSARGFNAAGFGNYLGSQATLAKCASAGMYCIQGISAFIQATGDYYNDLTELNTRITAIKNHADYSKFIGVWWDDEAYAEQSVPENVTEAVRLGFMTGGTRDVPILGNLGNIGMARGRGSMVDSFSTYVNNNHYTESHGKKAPPGAYALMIGSQIENQPLPFNIACLHMYGDILTGQMLRSAVYQGLIGGAKGVVLFKDSKPIDIPDVGQEFDIELMAIWDAIPSIASDCKTTLLPLIKMPHWVNWKFKWDRSEVVIGARNYNGRGHFIIANMTDNAVTVKIEVFPENFYSAGSLYDFFDDTLAATGSMDGTTTIYSLNLPSYGTEVLYIDKVTGTDVPDIDGSEFPLTLPEYPDVNADTSQFKIQSKDYGSAIVEAVTDAKSGSYIPAYSSDFSAGVDAWSGVRAVIAGNIDGIESLDDWLRIYATVDNSSHYFRKNAIVESGKTYRIRFKYYIPSGNTNVNEIKLSSHNNGGNWWTVEEFNQDGIVVQADIINTIYDTNTGLGFFLLKSGASSFAGAGVVTDDLVYIKDIIVEELDENTGLRLSDTCDVEIPKHVESISLDVNSHVFTTLPSTLQLNATVLPADATDKTVIWSSDDELVATVDQNGLVTAVEGGTCIITAETRDGAFTDTCSITVSAEIIGFYAMVQTPYGFGNFNTRKACLLNQKSASLLVSTYVNDAALDKKPLQIKQFGFTISNALELQLYTEAIAAIPALDGAVILTDAQNNITGLEKSIKTDFGYGDFNLLRSIEILPDRNVTLVLQTYVNESIQNKTPLKRTKYAMQISRSLNEMLYNEIIQTISVFESATLKRG